MARLAEQHDLRIGEAVEQRAECRIVEVGQRLGGPADQLQQRFGSRPRFGMSGARRGTPRRVAGHFVFVPAAFADQRHEAHCTEVVGLEAIRVESRDAQQALAFHVADRHHQPAADFKLLAQDIGHFGTAGGDEDRIERSRFRPAARTVTGTHLDVVGADRGEAPPRKRGQLGMAFDRIDLGRELAEHGRRITRASADFENPFARLNARRLDHARDDVRLRDRLPGLDRQRRILIREFAQLAGDERLARNVAHRNEHARVAYAAPRDLAFDHALARGAHRGVIAEFGCTHGLPSGIR